MLLFCAPQDRGGPETRPRKYIVVSASLLFRIEPTSTCGMLRLPKSQVLPPASVTLPICPPALSIEPSTRTPSGSVRTTKPADPGCTTRRYEDGMGAISLFRGEECENLSALRFWLR